ncbi:MAG: biotin/lipoate A/B protein ligase family protein [bacterium]
MAIDRAILEYINTTGKVVFRVYDWNPYCISLGFRQSSDIINHRKCSDDCIDIVRRPTGGRAVFHAREVTYSVIIPQSSRFFSSGIQKIYKMISLGLARGIQKLGIPAELQKHKIDLRSHYQKSISVNCFSAAASSEVMVDGKKMIGSAQRHLQNGVLQHGSILIGNKHLDLPYYLVHIEQDKVSTMIKKLKHQTVSIGGYLDRNVSYEEVTEVVRKGIQEELEIEFKDDELTPKERIRTSELRDDFSILSNVN